MKKLLSILVVIVFASGIFVGGMILGVQMDFLNALVSSSSLSDDISKASTTLVVLRNLEDGKVEEAKSFLNLQLDGTIIGMDAILPSCPVGDSTRAAKKLLARIAKHRQEHPSQIDSSLVDEKIQSILNNALTEEN
jgi:hypothetical protein